LAVLLFGEIALVKETTEGLDVVHIGVDVPDGPSFGVKTEVPPMQALNVPMMVVLLKIIAEPVPIFCEVAPADEKTRLPEAPFVAEDASRRNTLVEEIEPATGVMETEEAKPVDEESET
jgi:hypothetical protein